MLFSRSSEGLSNTHLFYGVKVMVYIEGENKPEKYDKEFYKIILNRLVGIDLNKFEIVPLGNCLNVKERYENIVSHNITNSICVIDRDYNFLKESIIYNPDLLKFSYGYSWESDFWSDTIIHRVIEILSGGKISNLSCFSELMSNTKKSAKKLSCYDLISQINAECVLDKSKSSFGVRLEYDSSIISLISANEIKRIRSKISSDVFTCLISKQIFKEALKASSQKLIQGHFWQKISLVMIVQVLKIIGITSTTISDQLIFNIAQTLFNEDIDKFLDPEVKDYYLTNFQIC